MDMFEIDDKDKFESLNVLLQSQQLYDGTIRQNFTDEKMKRCKQYLSN